MVAVVARHAEKSELFSAGERAHPTNERNKLAAKAPAMRRLVLFRFGNGSRIHRSVRCRVRLTRDGGRPTWRSCLGCCGSLTRDPGAPRAVLLCSKFYSAATNSFLPVAVRAVGISTTRVSKSSLGVLIIG